MQNGGREDWNWEPLGYHVSFTSTVMLRSSPPRTFVLTSRQVVITTSGAFKSLWSEQDGDLTFLHKIKLFF